MRPQRTEDLFSIQQHRINYLTNISKATNTIYFEVPKTGCSTVKRTMQFIEVNGNEELPAKNPHDKDLSPLIGVFDREKSMDELL